MVVPEREGGAERELTECALREVLEETRLECRIVSFVGTTRFRDRKDRPKIVAYWAMTHEAGSFEPSQEVDEMRWGGPEEAVSLLSYDRDRELSRPCCNGFPGSSTSSGARRSRPPPPSIRPERVRPPGSRDPEPGEQRPHRVEGDVQASRRSSRARRGTCRHRPRTTGKRDRGGSLTNRTRATAVAVVGAALAARVRNG